MRAGCPGFRSQFGHAVLSACGMFTGLAVCRLVAIHQYSLSLDDDDDYDDVMVIATGRKRFAPGQYYLNS